MFLSHISFGKIVLFFIALLTISGCNKDVIVPSALNSFKGTVDETAFQVATSEIIATKSSDELYTISGIINTDAQFALLFRGSGIGQYTIADTGTIVQIIDSLQNVAQTLFVEFIENGGNLDSIAVVIDSIKSALDGIIIDTSSTILAYNEAYVFYFIDQNIYFSKSGYIELSAIDTVLQRMDGLFDIELSNFPNGRKKFTGSFEDIQYVEE